MADLVVVVPGILGSRLYRDGAQIWGYGAMLRHPRVLGHRLALRAGDSATPSGLLTLPAHIPGLAKLDVYGPVIDTLTSEFELAVGENLVLFAYDWRRSCRQAADELRRTVDDALQRWRLASGNERARVVLVCHSMGGLVARWYLDVVLAAEPLDHVRALITIGTPHRGSVKAAGAVVNGVLGWTGATGRRLTDALRGFPSVYELLPHHPCVDPSGTGPPGTGQQPGLLSAAAIEWPSTDLVDAAADFHTELASRPIRYDLQAVVSKMQRTAHRVRVVRPDRAELIEADEAGDGTVPRGGSRPYGWASMSAAKWIDQTHAGMHNGADAWTQIHGGLTEEWRVDQALFTGLELTCPEATPVGSGLHVHVRPTATGAQPLLQLDVTDAETGVVVEQRLLDEDHGTYRAAVTGLAAGTYRVAVHDPSGVGGVTPITDLVTVL
jgi:pimeloyl-ACP methyl ester carboxylesterase